MIRLILAGIVFVVTIGLAIASAVQGKPLEGLMLTLCAFHLMFGILYGVAESMTSPMAKLSASAIVLLGTFALFTNDSRLNSDLHIAHNTAFTYFTRIQNMCHPMSSELRAIQAVGERACATKSHTDLASAVADLWKVKELNPALSVVDSLISQGKSEQENYCAKAFIAAEKLCPHAFTAFDDKLATLLRGAEN